MASRRKRDDNRAISEICELFWGRFTTEEIEILYHLNNSDKQKTVRQIFSSDPRDVRRAIERERINWEALKQKRRKLPNACLINIGHGVIDTTSRLFACQPCDSSWWRNVPVRKQVSICTRCQTRYDPVPRNKEWGWAEFECPCGNQFSGYCEMGVPSPCYKCKTPVTPARILPPKKTGQRRSGQTHSCMGSHCQGHGHGGTTNVYSDGLYISGGVHISDGHQCAHPSTRQKNNLPKVLTPSLLHDDTGSTVATFLPQEDLEMKCHEVYDKISQLGSIDEESPLNLSDD